MARKLYVSIPEYNNDRGSKVLPPQNFEDMVSRLARPGGFWRVAQIDKYSGDVLVEQWLENCYTDNGAGVMFRALAGNTAPTTAPGSYIAVDQSLGMTTLTAPIASGGTVTSISVAAPTGPTIPSGTKLLINPGTSNTLTVITTAPISGSGSVGVQSTPGPVATIASGSSVRYDYTAVPTLDPASLSAPVSYTASLPAGQYTYNSTTGSGNRSVSISNSGAYLFSTTGSPIATAASYTSAWLTNANPVTTTSNTFIHVALDVPLVVNNTSNGLVTIVEKL